MPRTWLSCGCAARHRPGSRPRCPPQGGLPAGTVIEVSRTVDANGNADTAGRKVKIGPELARSKVPLRLDGHLLRVIRNGVLAKTLPSPVPAGDRTRLRGGRIADAAEDLHKPASGLRLSGQDYKGLTEADHTDTAADRGRSWLTVHQFLHLPEPNPSARVVEPTRPVRLTDADKRFMWR